MKLSRLKRFSVLLAGGSGTRLWPVSREFYPKQLARLLGNMSLIQHTVQRLFPSFDSESIRIVCGKNHAFDIAREIQAISISTEGKILYEPCGRNTAPAVLLALFHILEIEQDAVIYIFPADHMIKNHSEFHKKIDVAAGLAEDGWIVTFGIKPNYPETGYGYIEGGSDCGSNAFKIKRFVEKPDIQTAESYVRAGNFFWNSGMFAFKASVMLKEFMEYKPEMVSQMRKIISHHPNDPDIREYEQLENISIDYAIMEKTDKGVVLPSDFGWSDIGSWKSLYDFLPKDSNQNVISGDDVIVQNTKSSFIMGHERLIAVNHLENIVVVETPDSIFVSDIEHSRDVKQIVELLKKKGRNECQFHKTVYHSWGYHKILEESLQLSIKRMMIYPFGTVEMTEPNEVEASKQLVIIEGNATVTINQSSSELNAGESLLIPVKTSYCVSNRGQSELHMMQIVKFNGKKF